MTEPRITAEMVVRAYCVGAFPMGRPAASAGEPAEGETIEWYSPDPRAVLPIEPGAFHVSKNLARRVRSGRYRITNDAAFDQVIRACAEPRRDEGETWISPAIIDVYGELHRMELAHSVEAWGDDDELVGGLYGVALGGAFFGESMFSRATDASKVCLVHLVEHLHQRGYVLLDVQFRNQHLEQFGVIEMSREQYLRRLERALREPMRWR